MQVRILLKYQAVDYLEKYDLGSEVQASQTYTHFANFYDSIGNATASLQYHVNVLKAYPQIEIWDSPLFASQLHPLQDLDIGWGVYLCLSSTVSFVPVSVSPLILRECERRD